MKKVKQLREEYNQLFENSDSEYNRIASLARAGLFDVKKLPILKRALEKENAKLTPAERKILIELLNILMAEVLQTSQIYNKVKQNARTNDLTEAKDYLSKYDDRYDSPTVERDLPTVIILKRKAIRIFPGRQKVGLYYSQALDRYVSIPFGSGVPSMNEEFQLDEISNEYKMRKLANYSSKEADIEDDDKKDNISKTTEIARRQARTEKFINKAFKDKIDRGSARKVASKAIDDRREKLQSLDAPKKKGQPSNVTKAWRRGEVQTPEYLGIRAGQAVRSLFTRNKTLDEAVPLLAVPAVLAAGKAVVGAAAGLAGRALAGRVAGAAATTAAAAARRGGAFRVRAVRRNGATGVGAAGRAAAAAAGSAATSGSSNDERPYERKFSEPGKFSLQTKNVEPKSTGVKTGADKRAENKYRQSLEKTISEEIKMVSEGQYEIYPLMVGENKIDINTTIAKKIYSLYESLNSNNKKQLIKMLNEENIDSVKKIIDFATRQ